MKRIFIDCQKYEEALKNDSELWDIKILGAFSQQKVQNPVRDNYAVIGFSEFDDEGGFFSDELRRKIKRKIHIKVYTSEKGNANDCMEVLTRLCKKLRALFCNEIHNIRLSNCEYITKPYAYFAEAELDIYDCYGNVYALDEFFKEEV